MKVLLSKSVLCCNIFSSCLLLIRFFISIASVCFVSTGHIRIALHVRTWPHFTFSFSPLPRTSPWTVKRKKHKYCLKHLYARIAMLQSFHFRLSLSFANCSSYCCSTVWIRTSDSRSAHSTYFYRWWTWWWTPVRRPTWITSMLLRWRCFSIELIRTCTLPRPSRWYATRSRPSSSRNLLTKSSTTTFRWDSCWGIKWFAILSSRCRWFYAEKNCYWTQSSATLGS